MRKFFTSKDFDDIINVYFLWKKLNSLIKKLYTRGINFPEYITEGCVCYVNGYELTASEKGSEDAFDKNTKHKIQVKGTSNFNNDLSSFFIIPNNIKEYCIVDLKNKKVIKYDN